MNTMAPVVTLKDKYERQDGRIYLTGTQALVRLLLIQRQRDQQAGLNTAGFVSGYRGSPMTAVDNELWRAKDLLEEGHVTFWPGLNENLAMTSVWGTQQVGYFGDAKYDGVYGLWYGKGPGLDQTIDGLRQANEHGTQKHGGVLVCVGDDPYQRSTIDAYYSELLFEDLWMPVLYPADIQEVLDLGLYGIALSRFCGSYVGYKLLPDTIETAASVDASQDRITIVEPDIEMPAGGLNARHPDNLYAFEERIVRHKIPAAIAFARANKLNKVTHEATDAKIGIVAAGMMWRTVLQALSDLGITDDMLSEAGVRILKISMPFPFDLETYGEFADGLEEVLVIDDKREQTEGAFRKVCYNLPQDRRPRIVGRNDENGAPLVKNFGEFTADEAAEVLAKRLAPYLSVPSIPERLQSIEQGKSAIGKAVSADIVRTPYFCPGCPHNTSTKTPEGSRAFGGVGCHWMATWMDRDVHLVTHMGAEGAQWIGQAPFVETKHWFQNLGEGTYFHSGSLAVRAAVAAGVNLTYKVLFNDAVAMTGGQPVDGQLTVPQIAHQMRAEGVTRIAVVSDEPDKNYGEAFPSGVTFSHRRDLDLVQQELREVPGVSILIYDQTCAAEKRRRRKRGTFPDPPKRLFINDRVCEGCGDCGVKSNCLAVEPLKTEFGTKRRINQSSCNKDYSCLEGFCPSFVTVHGGKLRKHTGVGKASEPDWILPEPALPELTAESTYGVLLTGVGGTGVVTIGALLGMAAHIDSKGVSVVDQLGFAQKGGPVMTHVRFAPEPGEINAVRINSGHADLVIGFDMVVAAGDYALAALNPQRSKVVLNTHQAITGDFTRSADRKFPDEKLRNRLLARISEDSLLQLNATRLATRLMGDAIASNMFLIGYAWQSGLLPLSEKSILQAIEINGVSIELNKQAFLWGRRAAHDVGKVEAVAKPANAANRRDPETLDELVERRFHDLAAYQDETYAQRYRSLVREAANAERQASGGTAFASAVARNAYKLMAYKDEYEVARLFADSGFKQKLEDQFEGDYKLEFNLAPPIIAPKDKQTGHMRKMQFGAWMFPAFKLLARLKFLRGTAFDPFGRTEERRKERALVKEYERTIREILDDLTVHNIELATQIATIPDAIRGYGHVKERNMETAEAARKILLSRWAGDETEGGRGQVAAA